MSRIRFILIPLIALAVLAAACAPKLPPEEPWEKDARVLLDQADSLVSKRQYKKATGVLDTFFTIYPKSRQTDRALYLTAEIRFAARDYTRALSFYKEIIERYPASPLLPEVKYKLGLCYFELGEYELAIANLQDRSKISDPAKLRRIAETLSSAYVARNNFTGAVKEFSYLAETAQNEKLRSTYRERIREIVNNNLTEDELRSLSEGSTYPADAALLRLVELLIQRREYRDAISRGREFLEKFPNHPEKTRAEMQIAEATVKLTEPRYFIGALVPRSGQFAFFGDHVFKGIQIAVHEFNLKHPDNRVEIVLRDTEGSPEKAVTDLTELEAQGILAAIGPLTTREAEAIAPALEKLRVPVITPAASGPGIGLLSPWLFRNALTNDSQAAAAANFVVEKKLRRIVILAPDDPYGRSLVRLFTRDIEHKTEILASETYAPEAKDFGAVIRKIIEIDFRSQKVLIPEDEEERKNLFQEYKPTFDAIYLPGYADRVGLLIPQLAFYNMSGIAMIGSNYWHAPELLDRAGRYAEGAVFPDGFAIENTDPAAQSMVEAYRNAYGEAPDIFSAQAYDAAKMVLSLLGESIDTPSDVRDGLASLEDFPGVSGFTSFRGTGEAEKKLFFLTVEGGTFVLLSK